LLNASQSPRFFFFLNTIISLKSQAQDVQVAK